MTRRPTAFRLDEAEIPEFDVFDFEDLNDSQDDAHQAVETIVKPPRRRLRWGRLLWTGVGGLVSLAVGLALDSLIRDLFARADWLGIVGLALLALAVFGLMIAVTVELAGLMRLKRVAKLRLAADEALEANDRRAANGVLRRLAALYRGRPDTARGRASLKGYHGEVIDGRDLLVLAERDLMGPLDEGAKRLVSGAAQRVAAVTAVSPRALVDVAYVLFEAVRLVRRLAAHYGGRPGTFGMLRLMRAVLTHLAVTGTIAVGDTIVQQILGHGVAARLSARLGEGVVNGLMTARIGLAAMDVCRPLPFVASSPPSLRSIARELTRLNRPPEALSE